MSVDRADFGVFFEAVRAPGHRPFPWQERLLDHLLEHGRWPDRVVAPTGTGKTAVVDVHVFAAALAAAGLAPRLPRRLVLVVARRVVVDSHDEHAREVARRLATTAEGVLGEVSSALRGLRVAVPTDSDEQSPPRLDPVVTARLRGGAPPPRGWRDEVEACAVVTGTPDMIGSRLLLQGYGSRPQARSRDGGLLAVDSVLVVDEAHLSQQLLCTARRVRDLVTRATEDGGALLGEVPVLQVVETTATPQVGEGAEVGVREEDLDAAPVLARRLRAAKPASLLAVPSWPLPRSGKGRSEALHAFVDSVMAAHRDLGATVGCVVNHVATAVDVAELLRRRDGLVVETLVGRLRPVDVAHLRRRRPGLLSIGGDSSVDVLVATQTLEVGVDLDLSALVTELAPGAALAQRAGRVNRLGERTESRVVVAVPAGEMAEKGLPPYVREDLEAALTWVRRRAEQPRGLSPWALTADHPNPSTRRRTLLQRVEPADVWLWSRTGDDLWVQPDLTLWLHDELDADTDVGVVLRRSLPVDTQDAEMFVRQLPPRAHETFQVGIGRARQMLQHRRDLRATGGLRDRGLSWVLSPVLRVRGDEVVTLLLDEPSPPVGELRPGDVLVLDDAVPLLREGVVVGTDEGTAHRGYDVWEHAAGGSRAGQVRLQVADGGASLRLGAGSLLGPLTPDVEALAGENLSEDDEPWTLPRRRQLADVLPQVPAGGELSPERQADLEAVRAAAQHLLRRGRGKDCEVVVGRDSDGQPQWLLVLDRRRAVADEDVRQTWTPHSDPVPLADHQRRVGEVAGQLARGVGLPDEVVTVLEAAGRHHDDGKADTRFQKLLGRREDDPVLAKSGRQSPRQRTDAASASGLPSGWRHEQLSALHAWQATGGLPSTDRLLVTRLVGTSHGHGRASFPHGGASLLGGEPDAAAALFDEGQWESLVEETEQRHGSWCLSYLEAVLRSADGRVSGAGS